MRCLSCNVNLTDFEATRKYSDTNQYLDLCNKCFNPIRNSVTVTERYDLLSTNDVDTDDMDNEDDIFYEENE